MSAEVDQQAGGRADRALWRGRGVPGRHELHPAPVELHGAAEVRVAHVRRPPRPSSPAISVIATTVAPVRLAISTVSPKWSSCPWVSRIVVAATSSAAIARLRVAGQERVDQHRRVAAVGEREARVAEKPDCPSSSILLRFVHVVGLEAELARQLEPDGDADEHADPRLLGEQRPHRRRRSPGSSGRRPRAPPGRGPASNQPPSSSASAEHPLQRGRGRSRPARWASSRRSGSLMRRDRRHRARHRCRRGRPLRGHHT